MVALIEGTSAPTFTLKSLDNKSYSLSTALEESPLLLLAFFKVDCPVCQTTAPYIQRLKDRHPGAAIVGISQIVCRREAGKSSIYTIRSGSAISPRLRLTE